MSDDTKGGNDGISSWEFNFVEQDFGKEELLVLLTFNKKLFFLVLIILYRYVC